MIIKSRPTTYAGARFRSRLEARWAAFFDLCGWRWEYEPVDAEGWVPDFLLIGRAGTVPVEVKPINWTGERHGDFCQEANTREDLEKVRRTPGEILVLGSYPMFIYYTEPLLGVLVNHQWNADDAGSGTDVARIWANAAGKLDFSAEWGSYHFRLSGEYDGDHHLNEADWGRIGDLWRQAGAVTQWRGK
jgi:hypothetical protein